MTTNIKAGIRFMPWIDMLTEVGSPILQDRDRAAALLREADELEARAATLRQEAIASRAPLLERVRRNWTDEELEQASKVAESIVHRYPLQWIVDPDMRSAVGALEGAQGPLDVLLIFSQYVLRDQTRVTPDTDVERRMMLKRAQDWWNFAVLPMLERMGHK
jgi:Uncharacterized KorC regulated protein A